MNYLTDTSVTPEQLRYIESLPWKAVEWSHPSEEIIDGMDGKFQVFVDDGIDETWVSDARSFAEAEEIARRHNGRLPDES